MLKHLAHALFLLQFLAGAAAASPIGKIVAIKNEASLEGIGGRAHKLSVGDVIGPNDTIVTGPASSAQLELPDQTNLVVGPEARLVLGKFDYNAEQAPGPVSLTLSKGAFRFLTGFAAKTAYVIKTPTASLGLQGTVFDVYVADTGDTAVRVHQGTGNICNKSRACVLHSQGHGIVSIDSEGVISVHPRWSGSLMQGISLETAFPFAAGGLAIDPVRSPGDKARAEPQAETVTPVGHLANVRGVVLVNMGLGFQPVTGDTPVSPGYRVRAVEGSADIVYDGGATVPVGNGEMALVLTSAPAVGATVAGDPTPYLAGVGAVGAVGLGVAIETQLAKTKPASP